MPTLHADAIDHLDNERVIRPAFFAYLDIDGDPVRATTYHQSVTFAGTGDTDLDGHTFSAVDPTFVEIGDVTHQEGGSNTVSCSLSGLLLPDNDLLNTMGDKTKWRGRKARLWMEVRSADYTLQGLAAPYYRGYMTSMVLRPSPQSQTIELQIENYLAKLTRASNRTYLSQSAYDASDLSANATTGTGNVNAPGVPFGGPGWVWEPGGGGGGGRFIDYEGIQY